MTPAFSHNTQKNLKMFNMLGQFEKITDPNVTNDTTNHIQSKLLSHHLLKLFYVNFIMTYHNVRLLGHCLTW